MSKLIVIEGTDCSGKETQTNLLIERLQKENKKVKRYSYPSYDTPTGKIVGGPYLGKDYICKGYFEEGASNVDPKVASAYYAADRRYNLPIINKYLNDGYDVVIDRYVTSNMAHQGGKIKDKKERQAMFKWLEELEYGLFELPRPDLTIFLHMPTEYALKLKENREEKADQHESDINHLQNAEATYLELAKLYDFKTIECVENKRIKSIEEIHEEVIAIFKEVE